MMAFSQLPLHCAHALRDSLHSDFPAASRRAFTAVVTLGCLAVVACSDSVSPSAFDAAAVSQTVIVDPGISGPYNVGFTVFRATMTAGRSTRVHVYYPTTAPPDCATRYQVETAVGSFFLSSPLCAVSDAVVAAGAFPAIVYDHGGSPVGPDYQRINQLPLHEFLASHGFIVIVALHSGDAITRIRDLSVLTSLMLQRSATPDDAFAGRIDPDRIGTSGLSAGASASFHFAAGRADAGILADPRIKAMVLYEPGQAAVAVSDAATLTVPYLIMGGSQFASAFFVPELFAITTAATPRIYVKNRGALHQSYATGMCNLISETREAALGADPTIAEPLTTNTPSSPASSTAFAQWNIGATLFASNGIGFGGGRNICNRVGVISIRSLDQDGDGFTDSPPFYTGVAPFLDPFTLGPAPSAEVMVPTVKLYTLAFFKRYLEGDGRYMRYLTPGYAEVHNLPASVEILP